MLSNLFGRSAITRVIIGCAIRVHTAVGPGVYENVYSECMKYELGHAGLRVELQRAVPIVYRDVQLSARYYVDLIVEEEIIVFNVPKLVDGVKRVINPGNRL
jgi:GxxExxY protein